MAIGISAAYGRWRNEQKAAGRRPKDGVTALFVLGKREERRIGRREWAQGWRLAEDDRRQRCAGLVGSWARMGGQFNGWLNTMPVTAVLCWVYCVRTASFTFPTAFSRWQVGKAMRLLRAAARERARRCGQFGKGNSGAGAFSVVRLRSEVSRRSGRFRWGSLYGKGGGVAEKGWGSRRKG